jgi:hypothetical protein
MICSRPMRCRKTYMTWQIIITYSGQISYESRFRNCYYNFRLLRLGFGFGLEKGLGLGLRLGLGLE